MMKLSEIRNAIVAKRADALHDAKANSEGCRYFPSRGTYLCTLDKGGQCEPRPEAECPTWNGTLREITDLIALVKARYPEVDTIYIGGSYDAAPSLWAHQNDDYLPYAGGWDVVVWRRDA